MNRAHSDGPAGPAQGERRSAERAPISIGVRHQTIDRTSLAQAGEISSTGMLLAQPVDRPIRLPCKCWLEFSLPGSPTQILARGEIVRQQERGRHHLLAVRFRSIAPSHSRMIRRYVSRAAAPVG